MAASASIAALKTVLDNNIYTNQNNAITGDGLNTQLDNIVDTLDSLKQGTMETVTLTSASQSLTAGFNKIYYFGYQVGTLAVTLPVNYGIIIDPPYPTTPVHTYLLFQTGSTPNITFSNQSGVPSDLCMVAPDLTFTAGNGYLVDCFYNGYDWVVTGQLVDGTAVSYLTAVSYDTTNHKLTKTVGGSTTDIVTAATIVTDGGGITSHQDISGKEDKMAISTSTTLADNTYHKLSSAVGTQTFTLPTISDTDNVHNVIIAFTTSSSPNITISSTATIMYAEGYALEASKTYEVNCLWNGTLWVITAFAYESAS